VKKNIIKLITIILIILSIIFIFHNLYSIELLFYELKLDEELERSYGGYNIFVLESIKDFEYVWYIHPILKHKKVSNKPIIVTSKKDKLNELKENTLRQFYGYRIIDTKLMINDIYFKDDSFELEDYLVYVITLEGDKYISVEYELKTQKLIRIIEE